jgi:hypothetical protein
MNAFIIFLYFILFPFGQLLRLEIAPFGIPFAFHALDFIVLLSIPYILFNRLNPHPIRKYFYFFWYICFFSLLIAATRYPIVEVVRGSFYLLRIIAYYFFFEVIWNYERKGSILKIVLYSLLATAAFGWFQYFFAPDLRYLKLFNWDDHLNRLTGTILDPGFMGILMVFGCLMSFVRFIQTKRLSSFTSALFFFITLGFTYSRASYLALFCGVSIILWKLKKFRYMAISIGIALLMLFLLPKGDGEGVHLLRTNSIFQKGKNYQETISIISDFPVFGVGYNTICSERTIRIADSSSNHACSGSDSSILFVLATTGVLGLFAFIKIIIEVIHSIKGEANSLLATAIGVALLIHSLFLNSLFYPWVMGIVVTILALTL